MSLNKKHTMELTIKVRDDIVSLPPAQQGSELERAIKEALEDLEDMRTYDEAKAELETTHSDGITLDQLKVNLKNQ